MESDELIKDSIKTRIADELRLLEALAILEDVYADVGPYGNHGLSNETLACMNKFFKFDDSE